MIKFKQYIKNLLTKLEVGFFRNRIKYGFLKYYPKGKNYIFDIINYYEGNPNLNIIDVGANIGNSALFYNRFFKKCKIFSFEPVHSTFNQLVKNTESYKNISCYNFALGEKEEEIEIKINATSSGLNSLVSSVNENLKSYKSEIIKVRTLDEFLKTNALTNVGLLKIDTEGYEMVVLQGGKDSINNRVFDFILCEVGFRNEPHKAQFTDINKFLWSKGYIFSGLYDEYRIGHAHTYIQFCNALFTKYFPVQ